MRIKKWLGATLLFTVVASTLAGCYVQPRPWHPYHRAVYIVR